MLFRSVPLLDLLKVRDTASDAFFFSGHIGLEILEEISGSLIVLKKRKATELTCAQ